MLEKFIIGYDNNKNPIYDSYENLSSELKDFYHLKNYKLHQESLNNGTTSTYAC